MVRFFSFRLMAFFFLFSWMPVSLGAEYTDIRILTEEYFPLNYTQGSRLSGLSVDIVREMLYRQHQRAWVETMPWDEAYRLLLQGPRVALFSTVLTQERKDRFRWAGPFASMETRFYAPSGSSLVLNRLEDAKALRIATVKDYYSDHYLRSQGFTNLVSCENEDAALRLLMSGQADLFPSPNLGMGALLQRNGLPRQSVKSLYDLAIDLVYIAFSKDIREEEVDRWQAALDDMKTDGWFSWYYGVWLPGETPPGILQLMTEDYPPVTYQQNGKTTGLATEIVQEILRRCGLPDNIRMTSWSSAYNMTLINPNTVLFSTERTALREKLFHWVGPIGQNTLAFYAKKGSGIRIQSLEDAKKVKAIATTAGWFSEQILKDAGFTNLVSSAQPTSNVVQLMNGEVQLSVFTDLTIPSIARQAGFGVSDLEMLFAITKTKFYIAISLGTPQKTLEQWKQTLSSMKQDGTFRLIYERYVPGADIAELLIE